MEDSKNAGSLASLLTVRMRVAGLSMAALASRLGISQSYLSQLLSGEKAMASVNDNFLRGCAAYLGLPSVTCFLLAGRLRQEDFFDRKDDYTVRLGKALSVVAESRQAQDVVVSLEQLEALPSSIQHLIVLLHETAMGIELMPGRITRDAVETAGKQWLPFEIRLVRPD